MFGGQASSRSIVRGVLIFSVCMSVACFGLPVLAGEYRQADVDAAIKLLSDPDPYQRKSGAYHLSEMGPVAKTAVPELIELLKDPVACGEAANALGKIGRDAMPALPALIEFLKDKSLGYERTY